jgi:hypothetical protein
MMGDGDFVYMADSNDIDDNREIVFDVRHVGNITMDCV